MIRKFIKKVTHPFLKYSTSRYFSKPRVYKYGKVSTTVMPGVFPPHFTLSTKIILNYISDIQLHQKTILELGCGSGIISLFAASQGAKVTASDINPDAITALIKSAELNAVSMEVLNSNLFDNIKQPSFDLIIINPPYYPKAPKTIEEQAWFCGENFDYFELLFSQLRQRNDKKIIMILSEDCELNTIKTMARTFNLNLQLEHTEKSFAEQNFIFSIEK